MGKMALARVTGSCVAAVGTAQGYFIGFFSISNKAKCGSHPRLATKPGCGGAKGVPGDSKGWGGAAQMRVCYNGEILSSGV